MRRVTLSCIALLLLSAFALAGGDDLKQFQGTWHGVLVESDGKPATAQEKKLAIKLVVEGDRFKSYVGDQVLSGGTMKTDSKQKPPALDATYSEGPIQGVAQKGIYELRGDTLTVNFAKPGGERPAGFQTKAGSEEMLMRYSRARK